ncbi:transcription initiation factor TFIID subunit 3-like isoform X1 [Rhopilema esculentum]|uniref:transcription initiation factor TFIID subunit 3-like isoform X1 n=1 Tax=Rhopilema esculentum TaxID=499914 RepID=UPI0031D6FD4B
MRQAKNSSQMQNASFDREVLKVAVAQICHSLGWNSMQKSSLGVLTDILERYIKKLSKVAADYCQNSLHNDVTLNDLGLAFDHLGVQLPELEDYVHQVESIHFVKSVPKLQLEAKNSIEFPAEEEIASREEWYEEYMPTLGKVLLKKGEEVEIKEDEEKIPLQLATEPGIEASDIVPSHESRKRPADSPPFSPVEPKKPLMDNQLYLPSLVRPDMPSLGPSTGSPMITKQNFVPFPSPGFPTDSFSENSLKRVIEERRPASLWDKNSPKEKSKQELFSPEPALKQKILSPSSQSQNLKSHQQSYEMKPKDRHQISIATGTSFPTAAKTDSDDGFSSLSHVEHPGREPLTSPLNKFSSNIMSPPVSDKSPVANKKTANSPMYHTTLSQPVPRPDVVTSLEEKKVKKAKRSKKSKEKVTPASGKKLKSQQVSSFAGSPQLFASPHILKSPPEPRATVVAHAVTKGAQKMEHKPEHLFSPVQSNNEKMHSTPEPLKSRPLHSTPVEESISVSSLKKKSVDRKKKSSAEKSKKKSKSVKSKALNKDNDKSSFFERQHMVASLPLKKQTSDDEFKSPSSMKSPSLSSPRFSVAVSHASSLSSPEYRTPEAQPQERLNEFGKTSKKKGDEKKKKKDKKKKTAKSSEKKGADSGKGKKHDTPSLKLTFKRAPSGNYQDQSKKDSSSHLKLHEMSPISSPIESQSPKVVSPQPEPTPRKQKTKTKAKTKTKTPVEKSTPKVKKPEPAVRIEPLVINDAFNSPDEDEDSFERMKKTDIKKGSSSKKEGSGKKGRASKKSDSSRKSSSSESSKKAPVKKVESPKKTEKARKSSTSKSENYQPDQFLSSPPSGASVGDQSVSRGLFIQTITEPTTTQVWYCPACLRPDDGSPMIGCDSCDGWYHWICVGINQAPSEDVEWYCGTCVERLSKKKTKKRKKKD